MIVANMETPDSASNLAVETCGWCLNRVRFGTGFFGPRTALRKRFQSAFFRHSMTRAGGETGLRYRQHAQRGSSILLFGRLRSDDRAFYFLGHATCVTHESKLPMAVTWRLMYSLSGGLFASFAAAVA